ncbi:MAG TPA: hypothetical protein VHQ70_08865, partial [Syntrophomonadaceae bacterium]|nr:hypothetical protein [Syntrophomonadaceae bacterium]
IIKQIVYFAKTLISAVGSRSISLTSATSVVIANTSKLFSFPQQFCQVRNLEYRLMPASSPGGAGSSYPQPQPLAAPVMTEPFPCDLTKSLTSP